MEDKYYIIENGQKITEVIILKISGNLYTVKLVKSGKVIRLPKHRILTENEVATKYNKLKTNELSGGFRPPDLH